MDNALPKRKQLRLQGFDYSSSRAYFITICSAERKNIFSDIIYNENEYAENRLTVAGNIAENMIDQIMDKYPWFNVDHYVIMPNHIHLLIRNEISQECLSITDVIKEYKSNVTRMINKENHTPGRTIFQKNFYDHIIRGEQDYIEIWKYIDNNPFQWKLDQLYAE